VIPQEEPELEEHATPPAEAADVIFRHGGTMRRSDGSFTVWLNNVPVEQAELPANVELLTPYSRGELRIGDPDSNRNYRVKPGQVLNLTQGMLLESYQQPAAEDGGDAPPAADGTGQDDQQ
jgi:hypothetical protein